MGSVRRTLGKVRRFAIRSLGGAVGPIEPIEPTPQRFPAAPIGYEDMQTVIMTGVALPSSPDGLTPAQAEAMLRTLAIDDAPAESLRGYVDDSFGRFMLTADLVRDRRGRLLELGANPYFTTVLLDRVEGLDLTLANYFGPDGGAEGRQTVTYLDPDGTTVERTFSFDHFDVEHDRFPYADGSFDTVLFCEIVEHLLEDPVATVSEINRVLAPDGVLVLTTPNVARLQNVMAFIDGANIYDPYSGFGPYGRHNREYTRYDLAILLTFCGFRLERAFSADSHPWVGSNGADLEAVAPLLGRRVDDLGQYLFVVARKVGEPAQGRPTWLYRSLPPEDLVDWALPA